MAKFLLLYRRGVDVPKMAPDEMQKHLERWRTWIDQGLQKGWLLDRGDALAPEGRVVNAKKAVLDGPFVETKEIVGGYSIAQTESIEDAAEFAKGCPVLGTGGSVEVRPFMVW
jgi:hypothetical protein